MIQLLLGFWDFVVVFLVMLTVVVFVHEMGHFLVARANGGERAKTFSIGFGPEVIGWTGKSGTRWKISILPLGGYVKMFGDADAAGTPDATRDLTPEERAVAFPFKKVGQRAMVVAAGPAANFIFGILVLALMFALYGQPRVPPVVGAVQPGSAAEAAGLKPGDLIFAVDGEKVERFADLQRIVRLTLDSSLKLSVRRDGHVMTIIIHPRISEVADAFGGHHRLPVLGVASRPEAAEVVHLGPAGAIWAATREAGEMVGTTFTALGQMISGARPTDELSGPLGIASQVGHAARLGFANVVLYAVMLSINLGLINILPVPLLDGGHLLFYGIEALRGRPLSARAQEYGFRFGLVLVLALMLLATRNDIVHLRVWEYIKGLVS